MLPALERSPDGAIAGADFNRDEEDEGLLPPLVDTDDDAEEPDALRLDDVTIEPEEENEWRQ